MKEAFISRSKEKSQVAQQLALVIASEDGNDDDVLAVLDDMRTLNFRGENPMLQPYWDAVAEVIDSNGAGAQRRRHAEKGGLKQTTNICYAPSINSFEALHKATMKKLLKDKMKVEGHDFAVPTLSWLRLQLSPSRETTAAAAMFTGKLKVKRTLQSRDARSSHAHAHYVAQLKKLWRDHLSFLRRLLEDREHAIHCIDDKLPWYQGVVAIGQDDKATIPVAVDEPIAATAHSKSRAFVKYGMSVSAADHDWNVFKLVTSVSSMLNIGRDPSESLLSGGLEGFGEITVSLHDAIFNPSTSRHHAASMVGYIREKAKSTAEEIKKNALPGEVIEITGEFIKTCMPFVVLLETDGGPDHNIKFLRNVLSLFAVFLVGNMDKLVAVRGCPGHSYLNTVERCMSILNLGLANLALSLDPEAPDWVFDLIEGNNSMKKIREEVAQYDAELKKAIQHLERLTIRKRTREEQGKVARERKAERASENKEESGDPPFEVGDDGIYPVGYPMRTFFDSWGWYEGKVISYEGTF